MSSAATPVRPRVARLMDGVRQRRLTLVVAGPGHGKSTALRALDAECWLDLTAADRDVQRLAGRLADGLGLSADPFVQSPTGADDRHALADALAEDMCGRIGELGEIVAVLDNADQLGDDDTEPAVRFVRTFVLQVPSNVHVVLSGRRLPELRSIVGHDRDVHRIFADDLALTGAEIEQVLGEHVSPALVQACLSATGGWPLAVVLIRDLLERLSPEDMLPTIETLKAAGGPRLRALATAVLADEPVRTVQILSAADAIGVLDPRLLGEVVAEAAPSLVGVDPAAELDGLYERGLLVATSTPGFYRLSPILAGTLPSSPEASQWCQRAAHILDGAGHQEMAVACLQRTTPVLVRDYLREHGIAMIEHGLAQQVLDALRAAGTDTDPALDLLHGRACQASGDVDSAMAAFHDVERSSGHGRLPAEVAWRYASLLYLHGDVSRALAVLSAAEQATTLPDEALVAAWRASCLWSAGDVEQARVWSDRALTLASDSEDPTALAAAHCIAGLIAGSGGDPDANERHLHRALTAALQARDKVQEARIRSNLCAVSVHLNDLRHGLVEIDAAVEAARGYRVLTGTALGNKAEVLLALGNLDEARAAAQDALDSYGVTSSTMGGAAYLTIATIDLERGDLVKARAGFERAVNASDAIGDVHTAASAQAMLARAVAYTDEATARQLAADAVAHSSTLTRAAALISAAFVELLAHDNHAAIRFARQAEHAANECIDLVALADCWEIWAVAEDPPDLQRLEAALGRWNQLGMPIAAARCRLAIARCRADAFGQRAASAELTARGLSCDVGPTGLMPSPQADPIEVRVLTLGRFQVVRGHEVVAAAEWQSRKARDLLKLLIARRGRPVGRDAVMEALWPDEDGTALTKRLAVLLNTVRRVLDPDRRFELDYFVTSEDGALAIHPQHLRVDVIELIDSVRHAGRLFGAGQHGQALALLRETEQLYRGDFLEEDPFADWAVECREEALDAAQAARRYLAQAEADNGNDEAAILHLLRLLERDCYDEPAWHALIAALSRQRRHGEARRQHARYLRFMAELEVPAAALSRITAATLTRP